jgi:hypothetical protein
MTPLNSRRRPADPGYARHAEGSEAAPLGNIAIGVLLLGVLMPQIDYFVVNVALATIRRSLDASTRIFPLSELLSHAAMSYVQERCSSGSHLAPMPVHAIVTGVLGLCAIDIENVDAMVFPSDRGQRARVLWLAGSPQFRRPTRGRSKKSIERSIRAFSLR